MKVNGEVLSAPAVAAQAVIVRTVDGKLRGLAPDTGKELWQYEQPVPRLSLRGTAVPVIAGNAVICGFDNGKVVALNIPDGSLLWETTVAPSHGRTELERLVDIDSAVKVVRQQRVRRRLPGARRDARARLRPDLVGAGFVELSRSRGG